MDQRAANGPVWMPQSLNPLCLTQVGRIPLPLGNKGIVTPQYESQKLEKYQNKIGLKVCNKGRPGTTLLPKVKSPRPPIIEGAANVNDLQPFSLFMSYMVIIFSEELQLFLSRSKYK